MAVRPAYGRERQVKRLKYGFAYTIARVPARYAFFLANVNSVRTRPASRLTYCRQPLPYADYGRLPLIQTDDTTRRLFVQFVQKRAIGSKVRLQPGSDSGASTCWTRALPVGFRGPEYKPAVL
jgi:hypothetical protein